VTQIKEGQPPTRRLLDQAEYVPGAQRAVPLARIVKEIDGRQPPDHIAGTTRRPRQDIDVADADQLAPEIVAPLLNGERVMNKRIGVAGGVTAGVRRPTLVVGLEGVIAVVQGELGPADGRFADAQLDGALVGLPAAPLAAVGPKARHDDP